MTIRGNTTSDQIQAIQDVLTAWETETGNRILLAVEGGSRGHGFGSPGSDFDVRVIYMEPIRKALSLFPGKDSMSLKHKDLPCRPDFDMEISGWTAQKALGLALASNPQIAEFARKAAGGEPHLCYRADPAFTQDLLDLAGMMSPRPAFHNLRGLAKVNLHRELDGDYEPKMKVYLQVSQALLKADWIATHPEAPAEFPLDYSELLANSTLDHPVRRALEQVFEKKVSAEDSQLRQRWAVLDRWIADAVTAADKKAASVPEHHISPDLADQVWHRLCGIDDLAESRLKETNPVLEPDMPTP